MKNSSGHSNVRLSRRAFLGGVAGLAASPLMLGASSDGGPMPPRRVREPFRVALIGLGPAGLRHLEALKNHPEARVQVICDVDAARLRAVADAAGGQFTVMSDYRRVLEIQKIQAVVIAAPTHWHATMAAHACQAFKHVMLETPACWTVEEGQWLAQSAANYARIVQAGTISRFTQASCTLRDYLRSGALGKIGKVECWAPGNPEGGNPAANADAPVDLNWDAWLGPARWMPYNPDRCHAGWRSIMDLGGGRLVDEGSPMFSLMADCLELDAAAPSKVSATGRAPGKGLWNAPVEMSAEWTFETPALTVTWNQPGKPDGAPRGITFHGETGSTTVVFGDDGVPQWTQPADWTPPALTTRMVNPYDEFFGAMRGLPQSRTTVEAERRAAILPIIGNIAYRLGRVLEWDDPAAQFKNDEQANRLLANPPRGGWRL